jgi:hypothetical protein
MYKYSNRKGEVDIHIYKKECEVSYITAWIRESRLRIGVWHMRIGHVRARDKVMSIEDLRLEGRLEGRL